MLRAYLTQVMELEDHLNLEESKVPLFKHLLFALCMFHGTLLERRKFGPLGFNIPYEFTNGDLTICISQLRMFLAEYSDIPFKVSQLDRYSYIENQSTLFVGEIRTGKKINVFVIVYCLSISSQVLIYTAGHINYGGRITDDWDRRCVLTILENYYRKEVASEAYKFDEKGVYRQVKERGEAHFSCNFTNPFFENDSRLSCPARLPSPNTLPTSKLFHSMTIHLYSVCTRTPT